MGHYFNSSRCQKSVMDLIGLKIRTVFPSWESWGESDFLFFKRQEIPAASSCHFSIFKASNIRPSLFHVAISLIFICLLYFYISEDTQGSSALIYSCSSSHHPSAGSCRKILPSHNQLTGKLPPQPWLSLAILQDIHKFQRLRSGCLWRGRVGHFSASYAYYSDQYFAIISISFPLIPKLFLNVFICFSFIFKQISDFTSFYRNTVLCVSQNVRTCCLNIIKTK